VSTFHKTWTLVSLKISSRQDLPIFIRFHRETCPAAFSFVYFKVSQYRMTPADLVGKLRISRLGTLMPCCAFLRRDTLRLSLIIQRSGVVTRLGKVQLRSHHEFVRFYVCNPVLWRLCVGDLRVCRFLCSSGLPPCVQLPPIRVVTNAAAPRFKERNNEQNKSVHTLRTKNHRPHPPSSTAQTRHCSVSVETSPSVTR
jgi:hypothetical protein